LDELEQLREKRRAELQDQASVQQAEEEKKELAEQRIELLLKKLLSQDAKSRLKNVKLVNHELYWNAVQQLLVLYRSGRVQGTITEDQVKEILKLLSHKREIKITRK